MTIDVFNLPVHPANEPWPMMTDDDLNDMADSIKRIGLIDPIAIAEVDGGWMLIDGKNRREACKRAGVEPKVRVYRGDDIAGFIMSMNYHRKNRTVGQIAMGMAMIAEGETK